MSAIVAFAGIVGALALSAVWRGYVLCVLWAWFVVPTFGLPSLTVAKAIGIGLIVSFLTYHSKTDKRDSEEGWPEAIASAIATPAIALAIGWVVHQFM